MSFDSSDLLSEGSQSHVQDEAVNDAPFSFHGYLDEVAGIADSGIDTDMEEEEDEEEEEEAAVEENNDVVKDSHDIKNNHNDVLMLFNESGLSYDESVQQDTTDRSSALIPMTTGDNDIEKEKDKLSKSAASTTVGVVIQNMDSHPVGSDAHTSGVIIDTATLQPPPFMIDEESLQNIKDMKGTIVHSPPHIKNVASLHDAMSPDSVQSPSKNQSPLPIKKVRMSPLVKTEIFKRHLETPPRKGKSFESRSDSNNNESKKPKTISPFSPTARKLRLKQLSSAIGMQHQSQSQSQPPQLKWSMAPSRKVSILVNVSPRLDAPISSNDEESKLCLYPNVVAEDTGNFHGSIAYSPARSVRSSYSVTSQASIHYKASRPSQEVILVNPNAFGEVIPTSVTVETARVVQQFSNKVSEDWVRKYRFDEVCWPDVKQLIGVKKQNTNATMEDISKATVADVLENKSSVLFGYGARHSGRLESMFGCIAGEKLDALRIMGGNMSVGKELGLLGLIVSKLLEKKTTAQGSSLLIKVSMVEILDEDVLRDLLQNNSTDAVNKSVRIRHPDNKGAILENVTVLNIESLSDVKNAIKRAFHSRYNLKERKMVGGRGHVIATLRVCASCDVDDANRELNEYNNPMIQLIDLACAETDSMDQEPAVGRTKLEVNRISNRRVAGIRKSMAGLGAILRRLVVNEIRDMPQSSMYRSCTLTKMIQRALDHVSSRALMISTVCPRRESYKRTLHTLNYMHRLLVKPSKTAESPFEGKSYEIDGNSVGTFNFFSPGDHSIANSVAYSVASTVASEAIRSEFAHVKGNREFMKSLVTDPRQRLATLLSPKDRLLSESSPGIPMAEITTINEVETDTIDDAAKEFLKDDDTTSLQEHDADAIDVSGLDEYAPDVSPDKLSALSDEVTFGDSREETLDISFQDEVAHDEGKGATFDRVLEQLDEIDTYDEDDDSDYLVSRNESSVGNADSPPLKTEDTELVDGHDSGEFENELMKRDSMFPGHSDDLSCDHISSEQDEELSADTSKPVPHVKDSRPDPAGVLYDEVSTSTRNNARPSDKFQKGNVTGISPKRDLALDFDDSYASDQSPVSTLTPYDLNTRQGEVDMNQETEPSISSDESFPLIPRKQEVKRSAYAQESNEVKRSAYAQESNPDSHDDQSKKEKRRIDSLQDKDQGSEPFPEQTEIFEVQGTDQSQSNFSDGKPEDAFTTAFDRFHGAQLETLPRKGKDSHVYSDSDLASPHPENNLVDTNMNFLPSGQNVDPFGVNDSEDDTSCEHDDQNVSGRSMITSNRDIVAQVPGAFSSDVLLNGSQSAGDANKNVLKSSKLVAVATCNEFPIMSDSDSHRGFDHNTNSADHNSDAEPASPYPENDIAITNRFSPPPGQNVGPFSVNDNEDGTPCGNDDHLRVVDDDHVSGGSTVTSNRDIVVEVPGDLSSDIPLTGSQNFVDTNKNELKSTELVAVAADDESPMKGDGDPDPGCDQNTNGADHISLFDDKNHSDRYNLAYHHATNEYVQVGKNNIEAQRSGISLAKKSVIDNAKISSCTDCQIDTDQAHDENQYKFLSSDHADGGDCRSIDDLPSSPSADRIKITKSARVVDDSEIKEENDYQFSNDIIYPGDVSREKRMLQDFDKGSNYDGVYTDQGQDYNESDSLSGDGVENDYRREGHELTPSCSTNNRCSDYDFEAAKTFDANMRNSHGCDVGISELLDVSLKQAGQSSVRSSDEIRHEEEALSVDGHTEGVAPSCTANDGLVTEEVDKVSAAFLEYHEATKKFNDHDSVPGMGQEEYDCESLSSIGDEDIDREMIIPSRLAIGRNENMGNELVRTFDVNESPGTHFKDRITFGSSNEEISLVSEEVGNSSLSGDEEGFVSGSTNGRYDENNMVSRNVENQSANDYGEERNETDSGNLGHSDYHDEDKSEESMQNSEVVSSANLKAKNDSQCQRVTVMHQDKEERKSLTVQGNLERNNRICLVPKIDKLLESSIVEKIEVRDCRTVENHEAIYVEKYEEQEEETPDSIIVNVSSTGRNLVSLTAVAQEDTSMFLRNILSRPTILGKGVDPYDQSSSDGESLEIEPSSSSTDFSNNEMTIARSKWPTADSAKEYDIARIKSELNRLETSLKRCVESTHEAELIKELAADKLSVTSSFNPNEKPIVRTIKDLACQADALRSFIKLRSHGVKKSVEIGQDSNYDILDTSATVDDTLNEIKSLKLSTLTSLDQIKMDHLDALNENVLVKQGETGREKSSRVEELAQGTDIGLSNKPSERISERQCRDESSITLQDEARIEPDGTALSYIVDSLSKEKDALSDLLRQFSDFRSGLEDGRDLTKSDLLKQSHTMEEKLHSHVKIAGNLLMNMNRINSRSIASNADKLDDIVNGRNALDGHLDAEEKEKDELEDRLTDEINKLQSLLDDKCKTIDNLKETLSHYEGAISSSKDNENRLQEEIRSLQLRVKTASSSAEDIQFNLSKQLSRLKEEIGERTNTVEILRQNIETTKKEYEDRLTFERRQSFALEDEVTCLQNKLGSERKESDLGKNKLQEKIDYLQKELIASKNNLDASKRSHEMTLSEYESRLENEANEKRRLLDEYKAIQNDHQRFVKERNIEADSTQKKLKELQNELIEKNDKYTEVTKKIKLENRRYEGEMSSQQNLIRELKQKIDELEDCVLQKSTQYSEAETKYNLQLQDLEKDLLKKNEANHALEETITCLKRDYENRLKFDAVEKAAMEEDISTLQQRLREETQDRDDTEYRLSSRLDMLTNEVRELKHKNNELQYSLDEINHQHESAINQLRSVKKSKADIEEHNAELERRLTEELKGREEMAMSYENKLHTCNQELREKATDIESLSHEVNAAQEQLKNAYHSIESELEEKKMLANQLSALKLRLTAEVEKYATYKEQNELQMKELQAGIDEEKRINSTVSNEIGTLKKECENLQGKLAASMTERMREKALFEAQASSLETELEKVTEKNDDLNQTVFDVMHENESLKERLKVECNKLSDELTERMKEKAFYESEVAKLSSIIEQSTEQYNYVHEELAACKVALSASEERLASCIDERCHEENTLRNRITYLENALKDCCSGKKELKDSIDVLRSEKVELIKVIDELNMFKVSSEEQKKVLLKERDDLIAKVTEMSINLQKATLDVSDLTSQHAEVERKYSKTLRSLEELKSEQAINAVEWKTKINELSAKLSKEVEEREIEKTMYENEISNLSTEASAERQKYLNALTSADAKYSKLKEDFEAEREKNIILDEGTSVKISSLENILEEKETLTKQLQERLDAALTDISALNETINKYSSEHSTAVRIHTENIYKLESIVKEKEMQLIVESENVEKLRNQIRGLNENLNEETEKRVKLEQMHIEEVEKLKSTIFKDAEEFERFEERLSNQTLEIEAMTEKLEQEISSKRQLQKDAEEVRNIRSALKELEEKLSIAMNEKDRETEKKEQAISEANDLKVQMEKENETLRLNYEAEVEKVKHTSQKLREMQSSMEGKDDSIQELETTVFELRESLEKEITKVSALEKSRESKDRENSDLLGEIQSVKDQLSQVRSSASSDIEKLKYALENKVARNTELEELVSKLRQEKDDMKKTMEQELEDSKAINLGLSETVQQTKNELQFRIQELEHEKISNHDATNKKLQELSERISELSIMKEALQDENSFLKEKVLEEKASREQIDRKNKALKTALYENERQVREEMRELESTMKVTISKIESKRRKAVEEERTRLSSILDRLESENDGYKIKIAQLESTIRHLESRIPAGHSPTRKDDTTGKDDGAVGDNSAFDDLKRENDELRSQLLLLQQQQQQQHSPHRKGYNMSGDDNLHSHNHHFSMDYHLEKERRIKAEEFAAAMAARAKAGFEERNQEIIALKVKVSTLEAEKVNFQKQQTLLLEGDIQQNNNSALSRPAALTLAIQQRDEALEEAKKYRSLAKKLNSQVQSLTYWVGHNGDDDADGGRKKVTNGPANNIIIGADDSSTLSSKKVGNDMDSSHGFGD